MKKLLLAVLLAAAMLLPVRSGTECPPCGDMDVPYPLSTGDGCGLPEYNLTCDAERGVLVFPASSGNHDVLSIDSRSRQLVVQPSSVIANTCVSTEFSKFGFRIDQASQFFLGDDNSILMFNCSQFLLYSPLNCSVAGVGSEASPCRRFLNEVEPGAPTGALKLACSAPAGNICCKYNPGDKYRITMNSTQCSAYTSVVNLDDSVSPGSWSYGMQIKWKDARCNGNCNDGVHETAIIAGLSAGFATVMAAAMIFTVLYRKKQALKREESLRIRELSDLLAMGSSGRSAKVFSAREMKRATSEFAADRVLGSGGFGDVYRGMLDDGTVVAVKTAKIGNTKSTEQVINEVRILSQVNHRNLVRLHGCCVEMKQPLLVYEYVPNGTLLEHLSGARGNVLDWLTRLQIALQTAEALAYLHSAAYPPIYHRDVKSSNILLDDELNVKVSDFGLSRLASLDLTHVSTCAQGTLGYLDPEYYRNYQLTDKSDVYSFGVVLLELVTSQRAIDFARDEDDVNLAIFAFGRQEMGQLLDVADPYLKDTTWPTTLDTILATALLALGCLQETRVDRPPMKEVVEELQVIIGIEESGEKVIAQSMQKPYSWAVSNLSDCD